MPAKPAPQAIDAVKAATFEELFGKPAETAEFEVVLDPAASIELDEARAAVASAESQARLYANGATPQLRGELEAKLGDARSRVAAARGPASGGTRVIRLRAIDSLAFDKLIEKHPPTEEQRKENRAWDQEGFVPALIAACSVDPPLSEDQVGQLRERWNRGEMQDLWKTCFDLCTRHRVADLGKG